jgi:hypothetical protein
MEIASNTFRTDLTPAEKGQHMVEWCRLHGLRLPDEYDAPTAADAEAPKTEKTFRFSEGQTGTDSALERGALVDASEQKHHRPGPGRGHKGTIAKAAEAFGVSKPTARKCIAAAQSSKASLGQVENGQETGRMQTAYSKLTKEAKIIVRERDELEKTRSTTIVGYTYVSPKKSPIVHEASLKPPAKQVPFLNKRFAAEDAEREKSEKEHEKMRQDLVFTTGLSNKWQEAISICPKRTRLWLDLDDGCGDGGSRLAREA